MKIIYKIINSAAALAIIPVLLFLPMFRFIMTLGMSSSNQLLSLFGSMLDLDIGSIISNATGIDFENLPEYYTIKDIYDMIFAEGSAFSTAGFDASALPEELVQYFTAAAILLACALILAVFVLFIGLFTKKKILSAVFAAGGFLCTFAANKCFTHIAQQLVSGKMSLIPIIEKIEALSSYANYLDYIDIDIRILELSSAYTMLLLIFGALVLINIGFHLAETTSTK